MQAKIGSYDKAYDGAHCPDLLVEGVVNYAGKRLQIMTKHTTEPIALTY